MITGWFMTVTLALNTVGAASIPDAAPGSSDAPPFTIVHLSPAPYPNGVSDEQGYARRLAERTRFLLDRCIQTEELAARLRLRIAAVNWMLAAECEPPMSRWLHRISRESDSERVAQLTKSCIEQLATARTELEQYAGGAETDAAEAEELGATIELLETYARTFEACFRGGESPGGIVGSRVTTRLARYLEDDRPEVAASALLWQAAVYGHRDRIDRALLTLPLATEPPQRETLRYDFFARLMRCRFLTEQDRFAAAWALLLQLEEHAREWFSSVSARDEAVRSAVLQKIALCDAWIAALDSSTQTDAIEWCKEMRKRFVDEHFREKTDQTLMRLNAAAPIVVDIPEPTEDAIPDESRTGDAQTAPDATPVELETPEQQNPDHQPETPPDK